jgi:hypothetical protein
MRCYRHHESEAVGTCKHCFKGVCTECAKDSGIGIVCSPQCQEELKSAKAMLDRYKQTFPLVAKTYARNAILLALFGAVFIGFSLIEGRESGMFGFLLASGGVMVVGAAFAFLMSRRFAKSSRTPA